MAEAKLDLDLQFKDLEAKLAIVEKQVASAIAVGGAKGTQKAAAEVPLWMENIDRQRAARARARQTLEDVRGDESADMARRAAEWDARLDQTKARTDIIGRALERQIKGELLGGAIRAMASEFKGVEKEAIGAVASIASGFMRGGPAGAALAATAEAISLITQGLQGQKIEAREAMEARIAAAETHQKSVDEELSKLSATNEQHRAINKALRDRVSVENALLALHVGDLEMQKAAAQTDEERERLGVALANARLAQETSVRSAMLAATEAVESAMTREEQTRITERKRRRDQEAAQRIADARTLAKQLAQEFAREQQAQREADASFHNEAIRENFARGKAKEKETESIAERIAAKERRWAAEKIDREKEVDRNKQEVQRAAQARDDKAEEKRLADLERYAAAVQNVLAPALNAAASAIGEAVGEWARYSRAQDLATEGAAISAEEAEANADAKLQAVLAGIAQESATQAVFQTALGLANTALALMGDPKAGAAALTNFASAAAFAAIAGGTAGAARGIGEGGTTETTDERKAREGKTGGTGSSGGRGRGVAGAGEGITININAGGRLYSTEAETEAALLEGMRRAEKLL